MFDLEHQSEQMKPYNQASLDELLQQGQSEKQNQKADLGILGILVWHLVLGGIGIGASLIGATWEGFSPFHRPLLPGNQLAQLIAWASTTIVAVVFLIGLSTLLSRLFRKKSPSNWLLLNIIVMLVVGYASMPFLTLEADITQGGFTPNALSIDTGQAVIFVNSPHGVKQILCIGSNQECQPTQGGPSQLNEGLRLLPGQSASVVFATEGDYTITSETTPNTNITITVTTPSNDDGGD